MARPRKPAIPFRCLNSSPEVIRLVVMMYVRCPLSLRKVDGLPFERGIDMGHGRVRHWWNRPVRCSQAPSVVSEGAVARMRPRPRSSARFCFVR
jgi:hypothetical protein